MKGKATSKHGRRSADRLAAVLQRWYDDCNFIYNPPPIFLFNYSGVPEKQSELFVLVVVVVKMCLSIHQENGLCLLYNREEFKYRIL